MIANRKARPRLLAMLILCLFALAASSLAQAVSILPVQIERPSKLDRAYRLGNGEIWVHGTYTDNGEYWIARVNSDGSVAAFYDSMGYPFSKVWAHGVKRYVLASVCDPGDMQPQTALVPLLESGQTGTPVKTPLFASGMIGLDSRMLVAQNMLDEPWLTVYDADLQIIMTVEQPCNSVKSLADSGGSLSVSACKELPDGFSFFGQISSETCYFMKINGAGVVDRYVEMPLGLDIAGAVMLDGKLLLGAVDYYDYTSGASYILSVREDGSTDWKKEIPNSDGIHILYNLFEHGGGYILFGKVGRVTAEGYQETPCLLTAASDGTIRTRLELPEINDIGVNGFPHENMFYAFGDGMDLYKGRIVFVKLAIDSSWFQ